MGVPALFRWLSKKYPKIVTPVVEEEETTVPDEQGNDIVIPVNMSGPNPNNYEFDNLYLDMNGIVHPCTHPEGKAAPETEEEMMVEVFKYTEKVVNMIRPRKLLFMAIDGVAPRAKMNQQRSRRFRASQEAQDKADARKEAVAMWEAMGKELSVDEKNKEAWDTNAITPGTPFMDLLASSLRYWVARKLNTDPGWKNVQVYLSDASVPGEGEHKIMDFIRRQRSNPGHDPNTRHVIYGLDADLIMLALATHEPHFRVLREDVFFQDTSPSACRICGQEGHYAAQCTGTKAEVKKEPPKQKPFIFLDVSILREYLEVELNVTQALFPFNLEQAIDDWILLIFFVGNDFLPHLPSLEIREGAIDTLLKIWKDELPRMGGYVTNHGQLELSRAEIILSGLARREDEIFRRRREAEERQDQNAKRRKIEKQNGNANDRHPHGSSEAGPSPSLQLTAVPQPPQPLHSVHPSLPARPDFAARADSIGLGGPRTADSLQNTSAATQALAGSNRDVVANRRAIRMANMSAAEMLKAELGGLQPVRPSASSPIKFEPPATKTDVAAPSFDGVQPGAEDDLDVPGFGNASAMDSAPAASVEASLSELNESNADGSVETHISSRDDIDIRHDENGDDAVKFLQGVKRKLEETDDADESQDALEDEETGKSLLALKVNPDGTVEQEDTVRLWEPGYRERYYQQKFNLDSNNEEFKKSITTAYVEGLAWVLHYYYQGAPSWQWFYPYHFAPFAADFTDVDKMQLNFVLGQPFKPFEQLMSVFPAASRKHIPPVFHSLMTDQDSPIIDFYPTSFEIDMNGKKMAWQGVALLPFIDEKRLLDSMSQFYPNLTESEIHRNKWGNDVLFVSDEHSLYPSLEALYGKRKNQEPVPMDPKPSKGINGSLLPNPDCIPGSTFYSPLRVQDLPDIANDRSLSGLYFFPKQLTPHKSIMLPGVRRAPRTLSAGDLEVTRRGGRGRGYGGDRGAGRGNGSRAGYGGYNDRGGYSNGRDAGYGGGRDSYRGPPMTNASYQQYSSGNSYQRPSPSSYSQQGYKQPSSYPPNDQRQSYQQPQSYGGYGGGSPSSYGGGSSNYYGNSTRGGGPSPPRARGQGAYGSGGYSHNRGGYSAEFSAGYNNQGGYGGPPPPMNNNYPSRGGYGNGYHSGGGYPSNPPPPAYTGFESYGHTRGGGGNRGRGRGGRY